MGWELPGGWLGAACARQGEAVAFSHHQPSMGPRPHPRRDRAEEGPFDSTRQAGERGLLFQCSAVCADRAPCAPRWGLFFLAGNVLSPSGLSGSGGAPLGIAPLCGPSILCQAGVPPSTSAAQLWGRGRDGRHVPSSSHDSTMLGPRQPCCQLGRWCQGAPRGWQLAVRDLGCMLQVVRLCSAMGPVVVPEVHPYPSLC